MRGWELAKSPQAMMRIGHWWHLLHFLSTRIGAGLAFYRTSVMVLNWLCGRRWFQAKLAQRTEMLQHFLAQSDVPVENPQRVLQQYLLLECLRMWKYEKALRRLTIGQLDQLIAVQGWQIFQEAISTGRGVILVSSHGGLPQTLSIYLAKQGYELALIGQINKPSSGARAQLSAETRTILFAQQLTDAFQTLTEGGLALILPDAKNGDAFVDLPFLERVRQFRTGFAELALMTGAVVLPAEATMTDSQKLRILFSEAFTCQAEPHQAQVVVLVEQYASYLRQIWRSNPANISYKHLKNYVDAKKTYATLISPGRGQ
jgi:KDO2-lipid IV(A) lauroyltransferase